MISKPSMTWPFEGCFLYVLNSEWIFSTRTVNLQDNFFSFSYVVFCPPIWHVIKSFDKQNLLGFCLNRKVSEICYKSFC